MAIVTVDCVAMIFNWFGRKRRKAKPDSKLNADRAPDRIYRPGDVIGGEWSVLRVIEGGLGVVYAAEHRESGERCVLKGPKGQSDPNVQENFA